MRRLLTAEQRAEAAARWPQAALLDAPLAPRTSWRVGGAAEVLLTPADVATLSAMLRWLAGHNLPWATLGAGTNVLIADAGVPGAVLILGGGFAHLEVTTDGQGGGVRAGAAVLLARLVDAVFEHELCGGQYLAGIPGVVGGAVCGNSGTAQGAMGDFVQAVELLDGRGAQVRLAAEDLHFTYRAARLPPATVITAVLMSFPRGDVAAARRERDEILRRRKESQPFGQRTAGSTFQNPPGAFAGRLLESAGLKGVRCGGAVVSERHANFIATENGAVAEDVLALIKLMQRTVLEQSGVRLNLEVRLVGDFGELESGR